MADLNQILRSAIHPALRILPQEMNSALACTHLLGIGLQESEFETRVQGGGGPARGYWQFEQGTAQSRGGVYGVYLHPASSGPLSFVCNRRRIAFDPVAIYNSLTEDDVLAAAVARLLMYTDPYALPTEQGTAWDMYCYRTWRPGKPHPDKWPTNWQKGVDAVADAPTLPSRVAEITHVLPPV